MADIDKVLAYIKSITAYGGEDYHKYASGYTADNAKEFEGWLSEQPKVSGVTIWRGYCFEKSYWDNCNVQVGKVIGLPHLTEAVSLPSFTWGEIYSSLFMKMFGNGVGLDNQRKVLFRIHTSGKYFVDITPYLTYKSEEYICMRDTRLKVTIVSNKQEYCFVECVEE